MPYIKKNDRSRLDRDIHELSESIICAQSQVNDRHGLANYAITRVLLQSLRPECGWSYSSLSSARAVFLDALLEFDRRLMIPYENKKIKENGDVLEYHMEYPCVM